jgi:hypothetical protein
MTFEEAIIKKASRPTSFMDADNDYEFDVFVFPESKEDQERYTKWINRNGLSEFEDDWAKDFCTNGEYTLGGIALGEGGTRLYMCPVPDI